MSSNYNSFAYALQPQREFFLEGDSSWKAGTTFSQNNSEPSYGL